MRPKKYKIDEIFSILYKSNFPNDIVDKMVANQDLMDELYKTEGGSVHSWTLSGLNDPLVLSNVGDVINYHAVWARTPEGGGYWDELQNDYGSVTVEELEQTISFDERVMDLQL